MTRGQHLGSRTRKQLPREEKWGPRGRTLHPQGAHAHSLRCPSCCFNHESLKKFFFFFNLNNPNRQFPSSPVARTWCFYCHGSASVAGQETKIPQAAKKRKKERKIPTAFSPGLRRTKYRVSLCSLWQQQWPLLRSSLSWRRMAARLCGVCAPSVTFWPHSGSCSLSCVSSSPPTPHPGRPVGRVCAWSLGEGMMQHSGRPLGILTAPALIKCGRLPGNPGAGGDFFSTYFTKKPSISSWLTTWDGVGDKLGSTRQLSPFFFPIPACILISAHSSVLIYHLKVEAG